MTLRRWSLRQQPQLGPRTPLSTPTKWSNTCGSPQMQGVRTEKEACTATGDSSRLVFASTTSSGTADTTMQHETSDGQIQLTAQLSRLGANIAQQLRIGTGGGVRS